MPWHTSEFTATTPRSKCSKSLRPASLAACVAKLEFVPESARADLDRSAHVGRVAVKTVPARVPGAPTNLARLELRVTALARNERRVQAEIAGHKKGRSRPLPDLKRVHQRRTPWLKEFH